MKQRTLQRRERIWEVDALRGLLILCVLCTHLYYTVDAFCIRGGYSAMNPYVWVDTTDPLHFWFDWGADRVIYKAFLTEELRNLWISAGVAGFFVLSGISCLFSRSNLSRGLKLLGAALFISLFTKLLSVWCGDQTQFIRFGVIHCYAYCHLIYYFLLEKRSTKVLIWTAIPILVVGYLLKWFPIYSTLPFFYPFGIHEIGAPGQDYWPIFPMLGWMLLGTALGRRLYATRCSLWPESPAARWTKPLRCMGQYSGTIYVTHIVLYPALFFGIGWLFQLF